MTKRFLAAARLTLATQAPAKHATARVTPTYSNLTPPSHAHSKLAEAW
jgi:hypothetical protein